MTKFVGRRSIIGLAKEASRGTATPATMWLGRNTVSFTDKVDTAREAEALGRIEDSDANYVISKYGEGEFEFDMDDKDLGIILTSLIGTSPVITGGPTYVHTYGFTNTNLHQSLSITVQDPDNSRIFPRAVVNSLAISVEPSTGLVKATVSFLSAGSKDWATQTASYTARGNKFLHQHLGVKLATNIAGLGAASAISLKNFEMTISANTIKDDVVGTLAPEDILNQQFSVEGTLTLNKEDQTYRNYMLGGTYRAMEVLFNRAADSSLQIQMPRVDFTEWEEDRSLDSITTQTINFKGNYDAANAAAILSTVVLTNTYAGTLY